MASNDVILDRGKLLALYEWLRIRDPHNDTHHVHVALGDRSPKRGHTRKQSHARCVKVFALYQRAMTRVDLENEENAARAASPFIGVPLPWNAALERMQHDARSGGHSSIITRMNRQVRLTCLRPDDVHGRDIGLPGFILRNEVWDERTLTGPWRMFGGWSDEDKAASWREVSHTHTDNAGRCVSKLCAQYGHAGGLRLPTCK